MRIPIYINHVGEKSLVGFFGLTGYEFGGSETKQDIGLGYKTTFETKYHRIPLMTHVSLNFGDRKIGLLLHGGVGLNILAGGNTKYMSDPKNKKYTKVSLKSRCDFTAGLGLGLVIKQTLIVHLGFNYGLNKIKDTNSHQCDFDASLLFAF